MHNSPSEPSGKRPPPPASPPVRPGIGRTSRNAVPNNPRTEEIADTVPNRMMLINCAIQMLTDALKHSTDTEKIEAYNNQLDELTSALRTLSTGEIIPK